MLAALNEGVRGFHALNPNHWGERWQAVEKIEINLLKRKIFEILFCKVGGWFDLIAQTFEPAQSLQ